VEVQFWASLECQCCFWIARGLVPYLTICDYSPSSYSRTALTLKGSSNWTPTLWEWVSFQNTGERLHRYNGMTNYQNGFVNESFMCEFCTFIIKPRPSGILNYSYPAIPVQRSNQLNYRGSCQALIESNTAYLQVRLPDSFTIIFDVFILVYFTVKLFPNFPFGVVSGQL
jgi:hypothetical protein